MGVISPLFFFFFLIVESKFKYFFLYSGHILHFTQILHLPFFFFVCDLLYPWFNLGDNLIIFICSRWKRRLGVKVIKCTSLSKCKELSALCWLLYTGQPFLLAENLRIGTQQNSNDLPYKRPHSDTPKKKSLVIIKLSQVHFLPVVNRQSLHKSYSKEPS